MRFWAMLLGLGWACPLAAQPADTLLVDRQPAPLVTVPPVYPDSAARAGLEGRVHVRVRVTPAGAVAAASVLRSDHPAFDSSAVQAVRRWTFRPAERAGRAVAAWVTVPVRFQRPVARVPDAQPDGPALPDAPPLLTFSTVLRANPGGCAEATAAYPLRQDMPDFSRVADRLGPSAAELTTRAWVRVDAAGTAHEVLFAETVAPRGVRQRFEDATAAGFRAWRYAPATCDGAPVASFLLVPMRFIKHAARYGGPVRVRNQPPAP